MKYELTDGEIVIWFLSCVVFIISFVCAFLIGYTRLEAFTLAVLCLIVWHIVIVLILLCYEIKKRTSRRKLKILNKGTNDE